MKATFHEKTKVITTKSNKNGRWDFTPYVNKLVACKPLYIIMMTFLSTKSIKWEQFIISSLIRNFIMKDPVYDNSEWTKSFCFAVTFSSFPAAIPYMHVKERRGANFLSVINRGRRENEKTMRFVFCINHKEKERVLKKGEHDNNTRHGVSQRPKDV